MRLSDFILLEENKKKWVVMHQGVLVAKRCNQDYMVFLFQIDGYYVETFCHLQNKAIHEYRVFDNTALLHPYLDTIAIHQLMH